MCSLLLWSVCHLSLRPLARRAIAVYPPTMDEQPLDAGIFDLATRRKCGSICRHIDRWALTPPFHPYPGPVGLEAVIFCHLIPDVAAGFPLENAMLCVARTFLFMTSIERQTSSLPFFYFYDANLTLLFRFHNFFISFIPSLFKLFLKFAFYIL